LRLYRDDESVRFSGHKSRVTGADFSDDGKNVAATSEDGTVYIWSIDIDRLIAMACARAGTNFPRSQWDHYMNNAPRRKTCEKFPAPMSAKPAEARPKPPCLFQE
jgi:WD40 repeat protein